MEKNMSGWDRLIRDYSAPLGWLGGGVLGALTRRGMVNKASRTSAGITDRANTLMQGMENADQPERLARLKQFWSEGQRTPFRMFGEEPTPVAPYTSAPGTPAAVRPNPAAPPAEALYRPDLRGLTMRNGAAVGGFGTEYGLSAMMAHGARQELAKANDAAAADPSEVNLQRLQAAKNDLAIWEGLANVGRGGAITYLGATLKNPRAGLGTRPDIWAADNQRIRLDRELAANPAARVQRRGVDGRFAGGFVDEE
jgi:hypothetical protein